MPVRERLAPKAVVVRREHACVVNVLGNIPTRALRNRVTRVVPTCTTAVAVAAVGLYARIASGREGRIALDACQTMSSFVVSAAPTSAGGSWNYQYGNVD